MLPGARPPARAAEQLLLLRVEQDAEHELEQHARDEVGEDAPGARVAHLLKQVRRAVPLVEPYRQHKLLLQNTRIVRMSIQIVHYSTIQRKHLQYMRTTYTNYEVHSSYYENTYRYSIDCCSCT